MRARQKCAPAGRLQQSRIRLTTIISYFVYVPSQEGINDMGFKSACYFLDEDTAATGHASTAKFLFSGFPTTSLDAYRTIEIIESDHKQRNCSLTDAICLEALCRIIEPPIIGFDDFSLAERALQAILLHKSVEVIAHGYKIRTDAVWDNSGHFAHVYDADQRTPPSVTLELGEFIDAIGFILCSECVHTADGRVVNSTRSDSVRLTRKADQALSKQPKRYAPRYGLESAADLPRAFDTAAYFAPAIENLGILKGGFQNKLIAAIERDWNALQKPIEETRYSWTLPPLLAIVLHRANRRHDIPSVIAELREELSSAVDEMHAFIGEMENSSKSQQDLAKWVNYIEASFASIIPETMLSASEKGCRFFTRFLKVAKPVMSGLARVAQANSPIGAAAPDINLLQQGLFEGPLVGRTITATTLAEMLKVESVPSLMSYHFSTAEQRLLGQRSN